MIEIACSQYQSTVNARQHLFLRIESAAASIDLWSLNAELFGQHLSFFFTAVLGSQALPVDAWSCHSFSSKVRPFKCIDLVWPSGPSGPLGGMRVDSVLSENSRTRI